MDLKTERTNQQVYPDTDKHKVIPFKKKIMPNAILYKFFIEVNGSKFLGKQF